MGARAGVLGARAGQRAGVTFDAGWCAHGLGRGLAQLHVAVTKRTCAFSSTLRRGAAVVTELGGVRRPDKAGRVGERSVGIREAAGEGAWGACTHAG